MKGKIKEFLKQDYRHYVSFVITLGFIALGLFVFPNAILRLAEAFRDFGTSIAYSFCNIILGEDLVSASVTNLPALKFPSLDTGLNSANILPLRWSDFVLEFKRYWSIFFRLKTLKSYLWEVLVFLYILCVVFVVGAGVVFVLYKLFKRYLKKTNNAYDKESCAVRIAKRISDFTYRPVKKWIVGYIHFLLENAFWWKLWLGLWAYFFNLFTIAIEFVAYYIYFCGSFNVGNLYIQAYKLALDLSISIQFIPLFAWIIGVVCVLEYWARQVGYSRLTHRERRNGGFVAHLGVLTVIYGPPGAGKTKLITDMALTEETRMRDMAFQIIIESDFKFPNMNWATLEQELKSAIEKRKVFSIPSVRKWLRKKYRAWRRSPCPEKIFGYDYERYGITYNDGLKVSNIWEILDDYACAYFIYTVQSSLLIANYSIRSDNLFQDLGNFPLWNTDFFRRDPRYMDSYSRHAHILDFDMLRLGERLIKDNPNRYAFGFGVYVISEIDKERKNEKELREDGVKAEDGVCNQKTDRFNNLLKMSRHRCVVANSVFIKIFADLQRPESLGADARELGEVYYIDEVGEESPVLPFFAPFYLLETLFSCIFGKFVDIYYQYRFHRSDRTLPIHGSKNFIAWIKHIRDKTVNVYNSQVVKLIGENGRMDGAKKQFKYYIQWKKIYSERYKTDCLSGMFDYYDEVNAIGIDDLPEYLTELASDEELLMQHSFFQLEVRKFKDKAKVA